MLVPTAFRRTTWPTPRSRARTHALATVARQPTPPWRRLRAPAVRACSHSTASATAMASMTRADQDGRRQESGHLTKLQSSGPSGLRRATTRHANAARRPRPARWRPGGCTPRSPSAPPRRSPGPRAIARTQIVSTSTTPCPGPAPNRTRAHSVISRPRGHRHHTTALGQNDHVSIPWDELAESPRKAEQLFDLIVHAEYGDRVRTINGAGGDGGMDAWVEDIGRALEFKSWTQWASPSELKSSAPSKNASATRRSPPGSSSRQCVRHPASRWCL